MNTKLALGSGFTFGLGLGLWLGYTLAAVPVAQAPASAPEAESWGAESPSDTAPSPPVAPRVDVKPAVKLPLSELDEEPLAKSASADRSESKSSLDASKITEKWEVDRFLALKENPNFFEVLREAKPFTAETLEIRRLEGLFTGEVVLEEERWEMEMEARLRVEGKQLRGESRILLSKNGKVFSSQDGKGTLNEYRNPASGEGLIVRASPDSYFHLFYLSQRDVFVGHLYQELSPGRYEPRGRVSLSRN